MDFVIGSEGWVGGRGGGEGVRRTCRPTWVRMQKVLIKCTANFRGNWRYFVNLVKGLLMWKYKLSFSSFSLALIFFRLAIDRDRMSANGSSGSLRCSCREAVRTDFWLSASGTVQRSSSEDSTPLPFATKGSY